MCGVIGLIYERSREDLGVIAGRLLRTLEYRGYDSTGAAIQGDTEEVTLRKDVGAPSVMVERLGIDRLGGRILCAQVRWATFGAVNQENSQPHVMRCKTYLYGAHNGNVTNCDDLKRRHVAAGHDVRSDNDGEMLVHTVEDAFARALDAVPADARRDPATRHRLLRAAVVEASAELKGSFAAVIVDPVTRRLVAIKRGSSLYFGIGEDPDGGRFAIASSDLSAVLKMTRVLVPLFDGEFVEFDPQHHAVYHLVGDPHTPLSREPARSRLRAQDTELRPPFRTFMEQEIHDQQDTVREVVRLFKGGSAACRAIAGPFAAAPAEDRRALQEGLEELQRRSDPGELHAEFRALAEWPAVAAWRAALVEGLAGEGHDLRLEARHLVSADRAFLTDLLGLCQDEGERDTVLLLDAVGEWAEVEDMRRVVDGFRDACLTAHSAGGRIFVVCCGTSFHAAKVASLYFAEIAGLDLLALLPGEFRGQYAGILRAGDLLVCVSQSGETKDLIDVVNDVRAQDLGIPCVALVNNLNSTLAQEKGDLVIPLRCGPEIAVPATKSFLNQLAMFYCLALRLGEGRGKSAAVADRESRLEALPLLVRQTLERTDAALEEAAELLFLEPSMHLLATRLLGVAKEGALKIREVVLNHTEGFEGSEFKHGPNTILGFNTIVGPRGLELLLEQAGAVLATAIDRGREQGLEGAALAALVHAALHGMMRPHAEPSADGLVDHAALRDALVAAMSRDYPLVYITGPEPRDVALTVSQLNTHKIRGACTVVIAEESPELRGAAERAPAGRPDYRSIYVPLPTTGDGLLATFTASVALQRLALKMSERKMTYLDGLGIHEHGVHPDVPKNVSKSITVD